MNNMLYIFMNQYCEICLKILTSITIDETVLSLLFLKYFFK